MTSRAKLPVIILVLLCALLSAVLYVQAPFSQGQIITAANYRPIQRHLSSNAGDDISPLMPEILANLTRTFVRSSTSRPTSDNNTVALDLAVVHSKEQGRRKFVLRDACERSGVHDPRDVFKSPPRLFVDEKYKVIYCAIPKIACTSWKKVFLVMNKSFKTTAEISQFYTNRSGRKSLKTLDQYQPSEVKAMLGTYTKFLFARHPFSRVLSAFKNKLEPNSTFERALNWQRSLGSRIIHRYREKDRPKSDEYDLTFEEFIKYLIDPEANSKNIHWNDIYKRCRPCDINYDIIGKFETLQSDAKYIMKLIHADDIEFPESDSSSPTGSSNQSQLDLHYQSVPFEDLKKLYERFKVDFELFGYKFLS